MIPTKTITDSAWENEGIWEESVQRIVINLRDSVL